MRGGGCMKSWLPQFREKPETVCKMETLAEVILTTPGVIKLGLHPPCVTAKGVGDFPTVLGDTVTD